MKFLVATTMLVTALSTSSPGSDHDLQREKYVQQINRIPGITWKAGHSARFQGTPVGSSKSLCGVKAGSRQRLLSRVANGTITLVKARAGVQLPDSFSSVNNWPKCAKVIGDIRDQSNCGCCWAFGAAEAASDRLCIGTNATVTVPLSAQETCFCAERDGCDGGQLETAWDYISDQGLATGGLYNATGPFGELGLCSSFSLPHCHHHGPQGNDPYPAEGAPGCPDAISPQCPSKCDAGAKAPYDDFANARYTFSGGMEHYDGEEAMMQAIAEYGPIEAAFTVYDDFENYVSGIYHATSSKNLGGHAIRVVGWGVEDSVKYWTVANSWNPYWGEEGYFRIRRGTNECGIEGEAIASAGGTQWQGPGITPVPPGPPAPGQCGDQDSEKKCINTAQSGTRCTWCVLKGLGIGICQVEANC